MGARGGEGAGAALADVSDPGPSRVEEVGPPIERRPLWPKFLWGLGGTSPAAPSHDCVSGKKWEQLMTNGHRPWSKLGPPELSFLECL